MLDVTFPEWDKELLIYLNGKNAEWLDPIMIFLSSYISWTLVCVGIMAYILYKDRFRGKIVFFYLSVGLIINSLVNNLIKLVIMRPRPGNDIYLQDIVRQLEDAGSTFSFFSAHSSNSICLALFTTLYFRNPYYGTIVFMWAIAVAYSRIYVGKHYPLDVICGVLFGLLTGWVTYRLYCNYCRKKDNLNKG